MSFYRKYPVAQSDVTRHEKRAAFAALLYMIRMHHFNRSILFGIFLFMRLLTFKILFIHLQYLVVRVHNASQNAHLSKVLRVSDIDLSYHTEIFNRQYNDLFLF